MTIIRKIFALAISLILLISIFTVSVSASQSTVYGIGFVKASNLRLREEPNTNSVTLDTAPENDSVLVLSKCGNWYKVNYNMQEGYMHEDYLRVSGIENAELGYARITGDSVNLRTGPSTSHSIAAVTVKNEKCYIIGINNGWYKVIYHNKTAYIRSDFVELTEIPYENKDSSNTPKYFRNGKSITGYPIDSSSDNVMNAAISGDQILKEAQKYLGIRYASGGASPSGFDCAGLVYYVLNQLGYPAHRTPVSQYTHGTYIAKNQLQPGDIVFFAGTGANGISHVGIYAGNGQFIHAPNSRSTVSYSSLISGYWADHYYGARRIS